MTQAKHRIIDVNTDKGLEISWVPKGSNPLAKVVLKKSAAGSTETEINMNLQVAIAKALAAGGARAAYVESLEKAEDLTAFFGKSADDQRAAVNAFAKAKGMDPEDMKDGGDDEAAEDAKKKAEAKKAAELAAAQKAALEKAALEKGDVAALVAAAVAKALEPLQADLKKSQETVAALQGGVTKATLEKRAQTEYKGLGLGLEKTVSLLKAMDSIEDAEIRGTLENVLKAHAELTQRIAPSVGYDRLAKDATSATARLEKAVEDLAKSANISKDEAFNRVNSDPQHAELVAEVDQEEAALREAA